jgi:chromosome segregation ATPase
MMKGKCKYIRNGNQGYLVSSEFSSPTTASTGYHNTPENQDSALKLHLMMMTQDFKKNTNDSLKDIQNNTGKSLEALKEETNKQTNPLKNYKKNSTKQVKELNKTIQDLKLELETIRKSQKETTLGIENLGKRSGLIDASITNRYKIQKRISGQEDTIENIDTTVKENAKSKELLTQNIQKIQDTMR